MKRSISDVFCLLLFLLLLSGTVGASEVYDFNSGWLFLHADQQIQPVPFKEHRSVWSGAKASTAEATWPFAGVNYDESEFRPVELPHDWAVEDGFFPEENGEQG